MENQLFDSQERQDIGDTESLFFYCTIVKPFGPFKPGDSVFGIAMDFEEAEIEVFDENDKTLYTGKIVINIEDLP